MELFGWKQRSYSLIKYNLVEHAARYASSSVRALLPYPLEPGTVMPCRLLHLLPDPPRFRSVLPPWKLRGHSFLVLVTTNLPESTVHTVSTFCKLALKPALLAHFYSHQGKPYIQYTEPKKNIVLTVRNTFHFLYL